MCGICTYAAVVQLVKLRNNGDMYVCRLLDLVYVSHTLARVCDNLETMGICMYVCRLDLVYRYVTHTLCTCAFQPSFMPLCSVLSYMGFQYFFVVEFIVGRQSFFRVDFFKHQQQQQSINL